MQNLTFKELMNDDDGYIYSIKKDELIPFKEEVLNSFDNDYLADAKFIINTIENVHPYFLTEFYDYEKYKRSRENFLNGCKNTSLVDFKFKMQKYFRVLCDGHMSIMPLGNYELNTSFEYIDDTLYLKDTRVKVLKIGEIEVSKILKNINEYFYFENSSNKKLYIPKYLKEKLFLEYIGCKIIDNKIGILTDSKLEKFEFINNEIKDLICDFDIDLPTYTIKNNIMNDIFYIDFRECKVNSELNLVINNIKNAISMGFEKFIIDIRNNLGGTDQANELILNTLNIERPKNGVIIRLSNEIKKQPINNYNFNNVLKNEINYTFYKPNLKLSKKNDNINLVVLTSKDTYSSAMLLALGISDGNLGVVIGEIPSNSPCCFGDMYCTETPRLKLAFKASHKLFIRPNFNKELKSLVPNIEVESEKALDIAIGYLNNNPLKFMQASKNSV